jgi:dTDP-D-glucose 4,6-dehydratase
VRFSRADISKAKHHLGFRPTCRVHEGLEHAIEWYVARLGPERPARAAQEPIAALGD